MTMTEIEARGKIKYRIANEMRKAGENKEEYEYLEIALQVMKEIREYRAIGTVEDIQLIFSLCKDLERIVKKYEAIGTVEKLKALKENQRKCEDCAGCTVWKCDCANERTYAIDEFAKCLKERWIETEDLNLSSEFFKFVDKVAEQMKGGATDERICRKTD